MHLYKIYILAALTLVSCTPSPEDLGFSQTEWQQLSEAKQTEILNQQRQMSWTHPKYTVHNTPQQLRFKKVLLVIESGVANFGNKHRKTASFKPEKLVIQNNTCNQIKLHSITNDSTNLKVCYKNYILSFDPSPWELKYRQGSAFIYSNNLWSTGFKYTKINTRGKTRLTNTNIYVKAV